MSIFQGQVPWWYFTWLSHLRQQDWFLQCCHVVPGFPAILAVLVHPKKKNNKRDRETTKNKLQCIFREHSLIVFHRLTATWKETLGLCVFDCLLDNVTSLISFFQAKYHQNLNYVFHLLIHVCMLSLFSFHAIFKCDFYAYFSITQFCRLLNIFFNF